MLSLVPPQLYMWCEAYILLSPPCWRQLFPFLFVHVDRGHLFFEWSNYTFTKTHFLFPHLNCGMSAHVSTCFIFGSSCMLLMHGLSHEEAPLDAPGHPLLSSDATYLAYSLPAACAGAACSLTAACPLLHPCPRRSTTQRQSLWSEHGISPHFLCSYCFLQRIVFLVLRSYYCTLGYLLPICCQLQNTAWSRV